MLNAWFIIELRVFYGYILAGILFLMMAKLVGIDKSRAQESVKIKGGSNGDFVEKYFPTNVQFCGMTFELVMTVLIIIEFYSHSR
jgi:hypothetical protein